MPIDLLASFISEGMQMSRVLFGHRSLPFLMALPVVFAGCGSDNMKPEVAANDPKLFWKLDLNHHAVTLSTAPTHDTLQLVATPRNYLGDPLVGLPAVRYTSRDVEKVVVTTEGVLVGLAFTNQPVWVVATLTTENLKQVDSVLVKVVTTNPPPMLHSFSIHPLVPDSAKVAFSAIGTDFPVLYDTLPIRAFDVNSSPLADIPVSFQSSDPLIAAVFSSSTGQQGIVQGIRPGSVTFYAITTVFGTTKADTLPYQVGWPILAKVNLGHAVFGGIPGQFSQPDYKVGVGATILWSYSFGFAEGGAFYPEMDITFAEAGLPNVIAASTANPYVAEALQFCPFIGDCLNGGNSVLGGGVFSISSPPYPLLFAARTFSAPGTYEYHSTRYGTHGRIVVVGES